MSTCTFWKLPITYGRKTIIEYCKNVLAIPGFNMFTIAAPSNNTASIDGASLDVALVDISTCGGRRSDLFPDRKLPNVESAGGKL